jgi:hypothetical protein
MTSTRALVHGGVLAVCVAIGSALATPAVAVADAGTTAAAAAIGAIVGTLIFDSSRNQYYYVNGSHRYYVSNDTARSWYHQRDPQWYNAHQNDFAHNPAKFDRDFRAAHHPPHP